GDGRRPDLHARRPAADPAGADPRGGVPAGAGGRVPDPPDSRHGLRPRAAATGPGRRVGPGPLLGGAVRVRRVPAGPVGRAGAAVRADLGWAAPGPPVVGYLGRFVPEKGVRLLADVLGGLATPWRALVVGGGPLEAELRAWADRFPDRVRVVTGVPHDRVPA